MRPPFAALGALVLVVATSVWAVGRAVDGAVVGLAVVPLGVVVAGLVRGLLVGSLYRGTARNVLRLREAIIEVVVERGPCTVEQIAAQLQNARRPLDVGPLAQQLGILLAEGAIGRDRNGAYVRPRTGRQGSTASR